MMFLPEKTSVRINKETEDRINKLIELYPTIFESKSAVIRASVWYLYNKEVTADGKPKRDEREIPD